MIPHKPSRIIRTTAELGGLLQTKSSKSSAIFILTDENVSTACLPILQAAAPCLKEAEILELEPGESSKSIEIVQHLWQHLLESQADRKCLIINFGGGVITDLGGFVAATYKRGVHFINVPTSLVGMIDASIGGKTGIDFGGLKNVVGAFCLPEENIIYAEFLNSLPKQELLSGFSEMLKCALVNNEQLWKKLSAISKPTPSLLSPFLSDVIEIKESIVSRDFKESGERKLLNFGHTIGHALESHFLSANISITHGECVAYGMMAEIGIAFQKRMISKALYLELTDTLKKIFPLQLYPFPNFSSLIDAISNDKKNDNGRIKMTLIEEVGKGVFDIDVSLDECREGYETSLI